MKILYSQIKQLIPSLAATPAEIGAALTMTGFMQESLETVNYNNQADVLLGFEIRQNRPDCLSVIGLAREIAAYFNLPLNLPSTKEWTPAEVPVSIRVETPAVRRLKAIKLQDITVQASPQWLVDYLAFYEVNSVNLPVDLSNYVMLLTGYPSHLIDYDRLDGDIVWSINHRPREIITLDGTPLHLKDEELIIHDRHNVIALAGIVGTNYAAISESTKTILAEMALYDPALIRRNTRTLHIVTEASNRLSKNLSLVDLDYAFNLLINLLVDQTGGQIASQTFEDYKEKAEIKIINFKSQLVSELGGITIEPDHSRQLLSQLEFQINDQQLPWEVIVPSWRTDIELPEDIVEEVLRLYRFDQLPSILPALPATSDITPLLIKAKERWRDWLAFQGWDEVLSWTMVRPDDNTLTNYLPWSMATVQNAINEDYPALRQTIMASLIKQAHEYAKEQVPQLQIFELGKVFGQEENHYKETEHLGWLMAGGEGVVEALRQTVTAFLAYSGAEKIYFCPAQNIPAVANPYATWTIMIGEEPIGLLAQLKEHYNDEIMVTAEIDAELLINYLSDHPMLAPTVEITQKLITLDANVEAASRQELIKQLQDIEEKLGRESLWSLAVIDEFCLPSGRYRYTVRAVYKELDDQSAKKLHLQVFGLQ